MTDETEPPFLVALNLTRRCNLRCAHCYLDAGTRRHGGRDELATDEVRTLLDRIAALSDETMVVITGGEPLLRSDVFELARHATRLGLMTVAGTNGTLLDDRRVGGLKSAGVAAVGISLDSLDPAYHDRFRGRPGSWDRTLSGIEACRRGDLLFQLHFSVTDDNADELDDMIEFAESVGAAVLNVFFLVCTGRGQKVTNVSFDVYDRVLRLVAEAACAERDLVVRARCAPHIERLALEIGSPLSLTRGASHEAGGCLAGRRYCRVTPDGELTPCPYMEISAGSVRERDFVDLWRHAPLFARLRRPRLEGRCGACEYAKLCGGCRARPLARHGNMMGEDFLCRYEPAGGAVVEPRLEAGPTIAWSVEAEKRLRHVPPFVRKFVRRRAEDFVRKRGETMVMCDHLAELARGRFDIAMPRRPMGPGTNGRDDGHRAEGEP